MVAADHRVREIWHVTGALDLSKFGSAVKARKGVCGRDATDPRLLVALWLWASIEGEFSARHLAELCERDIIYRWLCGGISVNHRLLSDFRTDHADALDDLFTQVLASLMHKGLVQIKRISQDGMKLRASAGAASFRRGPTLVQKQSEAQEHLQQLRKLFEDAEQSAAIGARSAAMQKRAAQDRQNRLDQAVALIEQLQSQQEQSGKKMSHKQRQEQQKPVRASSTDPQALRMKMSDGGYRPAYNLQFAADTASRAILEVLVSTSGTDYGLDAQMRDRIKRRSGQIPAEHLLDGGYLTKHAVDAAAADQVRLYIPPKPPRNAAKNGDEFVPRTGDSQAMKDLRLRMGTEQAKTIYQQRGSTSETINADLRCCRGLGQLTVRGVKKVTCLALWSALAYTLMHFAKGLLS
jgi:transposase